MTNRMRRYRRFSWLSDIRGIISAIGELRGYGHPKQPVLKASHHRRPEYPIFDEKWFSDTIRQTVNGHPENTMEYPFYFQRIFEDPIVGFVAGDDPIFQEFKRVVGPQHFTPEEILAWQAKANGTTAPRAHDISVVSYVLPIVRRTREDNAAQTEWLSERWAQTRRLGEMFSQFMARDMVTTLMSNGVLALAPDATPMFQKRRYPEVGWASPWSHRHIAYAAGLGTFGLHNMLITEKGAACRLGSIVVGKRLHSNRVRPDDIHADCLHYQGKKCMKCASRCPVGAISENGHDKEKCSKRVSKSLFRCNNKYHIFIYGCGLCGTGTPCEAKSPVRKRF